MADPFIQSTNVLNFGPVLDQVLAIVEQLTQSLNTVIFNQNQRAAIDDSIATNQTIIQQQITALVEQVTTLSGNVGDTVLLLEAALAALGNVATTTLQQQEISLLEEIALNVAPTRPVSLGLDFTNVVFTKQLAPTRPGP